MQLSFANENVLFFTEKIQTRAVINIIEMIMEIPSAQEPYKVFVVLQTLGNTHRLQPNISVGGMLCPSVSTNVCIMASLPCYQLQVL